MAYDPRGMKLLARGGQADIYEIDGEKVLRVLRSAAGAESLRNERAVMAALYDRGVDVPRVYECTEAGGMPALVMQRVAGPSLLEKMMRNPFQAGVVARELARLHQSVLGSPAPGDMIEIRARVDLLIERSQLLDDQDRAFVRGLLPGLPAGNALLHGDFHPGNILVSGGRSYIIDWSGAAAGRFVSDIAHSYLLMGDKPRLPGESGFMYLFLKAFSGMFARMYLKAARAATGFDMDEFGRWMAVRAAERTVYGQPSELASKARFVRACRAMHGKGINPAEWHKAL